MMFDWKTQHGCWNGFFDGYKFSFGRFSIKACTEGLWIHKVVKFITQQN
jgi:hypothetical protein